MNRRFIALAATGALALGIAPASASHAPNAYCSESGDVCTSTKKEDGVRKLSISLAAEYFQHYTLCVTGPEGDRSCKRFAISDQGGAYGDSVNWARQFPDQGPGAYTVVWKSGGSRISKRLGFHNN